MDVEEVRRILFSRVQSSDAENVLKIMGYLLLQDWAEQELAMLALGSDEVLDALVDRAKMELGLHGSSSSSFSSCEKKLGSSGSWARALGLEQLSFGSSDQLSFGLVVGQLSFGDGTSAAVAPLASSSASMKKMAAPPRDSSSASMMNMAVPPLDSSSASMMNMAVPPLDSCSASMMSMAAPPLGSSSSSMMNMAAPPLDSSASMKMATMMTMMPSPRTPSSNSGSSSSNSADDELNMLSYFCDAGSSNNSFGSSYAAAIAMPKLNGSSSSRPIVPYTHPAPQWCTTATASTPSALPHLPLVPSLFHDKNPAFSYNSHLEDHLPPRHHGFFRPSPPPPPPPSSSSVIINGSPPSNHHSMISIHRSCLFFSRGYCKHGNMCRFLHQIDGPERCSANTGSFNGDLEVESSGSEDGFGGYAHHHLGFESFEMELRELLKGRKTPVSIASLPQMYYERFGKSLQADGYLTESQRHGKAGFSLTRLLMKLKGTVRLIERPHGQHAVMLLEESLRLSKDGGRRDPDELVDTMNASSRQIYLTFPAESSFTEEDVTIHFRAYGPVQDVRIPHQQKRMFGFVTFIYPDTVRTILTEGNPHYICGARVLVKPYKEKGRKSSPAAIHRERQGGHLVLQEEKPNIEPRVVEQELRQVEMNGNEQKEATLNPIGTKTDASEFDMADVSLLSSNFKYVLDLLEGENKDAEISDSTLLSVSRINSKALNLKLGSTENISADTITTTSLQKVRGNPWSSQNAHAGQYGWGPTTLFARDVF